MKKFVLFIAFVLISVMAFSQSAVVPVGGTATGNGGTVTYTVGQVATQTNSDGTTSVSEGVQQPYEISIVGVDEHPEITLSAKLFPNPTMGHLQLTIDNAQLSGEVKVFDANGKFLFAKNIEGMATDFDISSYAPGTYYVRVVNGHALLKTFKVVKMSR